MKRPIKFQLFQNVFEKENVSPKMSLVSLSVTDILLAILIGTYCTLLSPTACVTALMTTRLPVCDSLDDIADPSGSGGVANGIAMTTPLTRSDGSGYLQKGQHFEMKSICF